MLGHLAKAFPWVTKPLIVGAPMRVMSGPSLALAISQAGGLGFIGPGARPEHTIADLKVFRELLNDASASSSPQGFSQTSMLPVGIGFQLWNGNLDVAERAVKEFRPSVSWLFAPRSGQGDLDRWTARLRESCPEAQVWIQIGTLQEALDVVRSATRPDVLVVQGAESGGHGRAQDGLGLVTLLPEVADATAGTGIKLIAAGGIADGRGVAAALALGAHDVALGTRFLAANEARISKGYQQEVVRASDGAKSTGRTMLYNQLRGTTGWPECYSPRGILNQSWHEHKAGVDFDELKRRHDAAAESGDAGWGPEGRLATYAGAGVGLIHSVDNAANIVARLQNDTRFYLDEAMRDLV